MKICIDARWIFEKLSGIGVHTRELVRALSELDPENEYHVLFCDAAVQERTELETGFAARENWHSQRVPWGVFSPSNQWQLPRWLKREGIEVFHSPNYMIPFRAFPRNRRGSVKCVVTLHDLIPMLFRDHAPKSKKARMYPLYHQLMMQVGARADTILAVSDASANDVRAQLKPKGDVVTVYNGISERYRPGDEAKRGDTVLYVGRFDPYKNVPLLVEAFAELRAQLDAEVRLQVIGAPDPRYPEARERAKALGLEGAIDWQEYVSDEALLAAYQSARVLVLPSDYEGFGMPVLEAMACGTPAICARSSSLPEVAGEVGIYFESGNRAQLVRAMVDVFQQGGPAREELIAQAGRFTWHRAAEATLKEYLA